MKKQNNQTKGLATIPEELPKDENAYRLYFFNILYNFLKLKWRISQTDFCILFKELNINTLHRWMHCSNMPSTKLIKESIEKIDDRILKLFPNNSNAKKHPKFKELQNYFANCDKYPFKKHVRENFLKKENFEEFIRYLLLESYENANDKIDENYILIKQANVVTKQIAEKVNNSLREKCDVKIETYYEEDINGLISIQFHNMSKTYVVLLAFLYSSIYEKKKLDTIIENFGNTNKYKGDMRILFLRDYLSNESKIIADKNNVYIEKINELEVETDIKHFYWSKNVDQELIIQMNLYTNTVLNHFEKYYDTISKNQVFSKYMKELEIDEKGKNRDEAYRRLEKFGTFYNTKTLSLLESKFETKLLEANFSNSERNYGAVKLKQSCYKSKTGIKKLVVLGYTALPQLLKLHTHYDEIVMLDNSQVFCDMFNFFKEDCLDNETRDEYKKNINYAIKKTKCCKFYLFNSTITSINQNLFNSVDQIIVAGGYASFLKNLKQYLTLFNLWLKPGGTAMLSFFNQHNILKSPEMQIRRKNLDFDYHIDTEIATSNIVPGYEHEIFCKARSFREAKDIIGKYLSVKSAHTHPFISLFATTEERDIEQLFSDIDQTYSLSKETGMEPGYFLSIIAQKELCREKCFYKPLTENEIEKINHKYLYNRIEQFEELKKNDNSGFVLNDGENIIKTLIIITEPADSLFVVILSANKLLDHETENMGVFCSKTRLCSISELNKLGIEAGNISPFIKINKDCVSYFYDSKLLEIESDWFFIGSNDCEVTLKIKKEVFLKKLEDEGFEQKELSTSDFLLEN